MASLRRAIAAAVTSIDDVIASESMFSSGDAYWVNGKEIAHFEDDSTLEIRLTKAVIRDRRPAFKADNRVELRPSGADWITVRFATQEDVAFIADLVEVAAQAHRPASGGTPTPPPTGADLERRRRFH